MLYLVDGPVTYLIASNGWKYREKYLNILNKYFPKITYIFLTQNVKFSGNLN
jgi:flavorubredoxin